MLNSSVLISLLIVALLSHVIEGIVPHKANPCIASCYTDPQAALSEECSHCCRTAVHRVNWNCKPEDNDAKNDPNKMPLFGDGGSSGPTEYNPDLPSAACCAGEWVPSCWDTPGPANFFHSCDMCCGECSDNFGGCGGCQDQPCSNSSYIVTIKKSGNQCQSCYSACDSFCSSMGLNAAVPPPTLDVPFCCSCTSSAAPTQTFCQQGGSCAAGHEHECMVCGAATDLPSLIMVTTSSVLLLLTVHN